MDDPKKRSGRPKLTEGKRSRFINVRFTEEEFQTVSDLEKSLGITKTELIRMRVLTHAKETLISSKELIRYLDSVGAELSRIGNNINQLARHANSLKLKGGLNPSVIAQFNLLFEDYILVQQSVETALRKIVRVTRH
ncbi:plasmid mobilization relaxosome protein MobC [Mucilaginibacter sp. Bleaf8]|uniref:plasmid mobilization protein n=1 Tax=Mucilaginibacter sp. Bleaf8 TaxID=2834430 RepID=UPI001BD1932C|nr:plasmid mobilization relaxosome protein MobC [Mucilaginibacter sp. Bleaf8]MBS7565552.1 plasmid mobilization relaxosome protein MobC [Mucilaginibacter sp. Bleaf8]